MFDVFGCVLECVLVIKDASSTNLRESNRLKSQKTLRAAGVQKTVSFKLALANT